MKKLLTGILALGLAASMGITAFALDGTPSSDKTDLTKVGKVTVKISKS